MASLLQPRISNQLCILFSSIAAHLLHFKQSGSRPDLPLSFPSSAINCSVYLRLRWRVRPKEPKELRAPHLLSFAERLHARALLFCQGNQIVQPIQTRGREERGVEGRGGSDLLLALYYYYYYYYRWHCDWRGGGSEHRASQPKGSPCRCSDAISPR